VIVGVDAPSSVPSKFDVTMT